MFDSSLISFHFCGTCEKLNPIRFIKILLSWMDRNGVEHELERTYRTLWPYLDVNKQDLENPYSTIDEDEDE